MSYVCAPLSILRTLACCTLIGLAASNFVELATIDAQALAELETLKAKDKHECATAVFSAHAAEGCEFFSDDRRKQLALSYVQCRLSKDKRPTLPCDEEQLVSSPDTCLSRITEAQYAIYLELFVHIDTSCYLYHSKQWQARTAGLVNLLTSRSAATVNLLGSVLDANSEALERAMGTAAQVANVSEALQGLGAAIGREKEEATAAFGALGEHLREIGGYVETVLRLQGMFTTNLLLLETVMFYSVAAAAVWFVTGSARTASARWKMSIGLLVCAAAEYGLVQWYSAQGPVGVANPPPTWSDLADSIMQAAYDAATSLGVSMTENSNDSSDAPTEASTGTTATWKAVARGWLVTAFRFLWTLLAYTFAAAWHFLLSIAAPVLMVLAAAADSMLRNGVARSDGVLLHFRSIDLKALDMSSMQRLLRLLYLGWCAVVLLYAVVYYVDLNRKSHESIAQLNDKLDTLLSRLPGEDGSGATPGKPSAGTPSGTSSNHARRSPWSVSSLFSGPGTGQGKLLALQDGPLATPAPARAASGSKAPAFSPDSVSARRAGTGAAATPDSSSARLAAQSRYVSLSSPVGIVRAPDDLLPSDLFADSDEDEADEDYDPAAPDGLVSLYPYASVTGRPLFAHQLEQDEVETLSAVESILGPRGSSSSSSASSSAGTGLLSAVAAAPREYSLRARDPATGYAACAMPVLAMLPRHEDDSGSGIAAVQKPMNPLLAYESAAAFGLLVRMGEVASALARSQFAASYPVPSLSSSASRGDGDGVDAQEVDSDWSETDEEAEAEEEEGGEVEGGGDADGDAVMEGSSAGVGAGSVRKRWAVTEKLDANDNHDADADGLASPATASGRKRSRAAATPASTRRKRGQAKSPASGGAAGVESESDTDAEGGATSEAGKPRPTKRRRRA